MTDHHVHIGQFNEIYFDAYSVFQSIEETCVQTGITEVYYSSTSSCRDDAELSKVEEEIAYAQAFKSKKIVVKPYLWYIPKYAEENISVKSALNAFDYCGIKLHPFAQKWDFENPCHKKALEEIFECCTENKSVLIHCGKTPETLPSRFEPFFKIFPDANVILAHSNPVNITIKMLKKYKNVKSDTAYSDEKDIIALMKSGVKEKVLFGTDFPLTHYFDRLLFGKKRTMNEQYIEDCRKIKLFS